jgi:perosamine synthetase
MVHGSGESALLQGRSIQPVSATAKDVLAAGVVAAIRAAIGTDKAGLHEPRFVGNELDYLKECLASTFVSTAGKFVDRFETALAEFTGARHAVAVVNGTAALQIALKLAGVRANDEVLVPTLTFVATANAVVYCGAIPHFVDGDLRTLGVNVAKLRTYLAARTTRHDGQCTNRDTGRTIRAIVPMHTFGHPVDIDGLMEVAREFALEVVEDAAESLGSYYHGRHTGTFGRLASLSFNGNKVVTTGGGGAILTNDAELARRAKHLTTTAKVPHAWEIRHDEVGYNYRLPNLNAALGCAQLEQLPRFLRAKRALFQKYKATFAGVNGVGLFQEPDGCVSNYWLQTLVLDDMHAAERDHLLETANGAGFVSRPVWTLMHRLAPYKSCPRMDLSVAEALARRLVNIPSSPHLVPETI